MTDEYLTVNKMLQELQLDKQLYLVVPKDCFTLILFVTVVGKNVIRQENFP